MARLLTDRLLVASPDLNDPNFARSVVYVLEHDVHGALGVIINRPTEVRVEEHFEPLGSAVCYPFVFFEGGPVSPGGVVALGSTNLEPPTVVDLDTIVGPTGAIPSQLRVFLGYAGWSASQLDEELLQGSWIPVDTVRSGLSGDDIFGADPAGLWRRVLGRQSGPVSRLALYPDNLIVN